MGFDEAMYADDRTGTAIPSQDLRTRSGPGGTSIRLTGVVRQPLWTIVCSLYMWGKQQHQILYLCCTDAPDIILTHSSSDGVLPRMFDEGYAFQVRKDRLVYMDPHEVMLVSFHPVDRREPTGPKRTITTSSSPPVLLRRPPMARGSRRRMTSWWYGP